jgi:hypothetical protein
MSNMTNTRQETDVDRFTGEQQKDDRSDEPFTEDREIAYAEPEMKKRTVNEDNSIMHYSRKSWFAPLAAIIGILILVGLFVLIF